MIAPESTASVDVAHIADLLGELSQVQTELLDLLQEKQRRMASKDIGNLAELLPREQELTRRMQACHDCRAALLSSGGPRWLARRQHRRAGGRGRKRKARAASIAGEGIGCANAALAASQPAELGAGTARTAACGAASGNYRHWRPNAADVWKWGQLALPWQPVKQRSLGKTLNPSPRYSGERAGVRG